MLWENRTFFLVLTKTEALGDPHIASIDSDAIIFSIVKHQVVIAACSVKMPSSWNDVPNVRLTNNIQCNISGLGFDSILTNLNPLLNLLSLSFLNLRNSSVAFCSN